MKELTDYVKLCGKICENEWGYEFSKTENGQTIVSVWEESDQPVIKYLFDKNGKFLKKIQKTS